MLSPLNRLITSSLVVTRFVFPTFNTSRSRSSLSSVSTRREIEGYHQLIVATDQEKIKRIARYHFISDLPFSLEKDNFSPYELGQLVESIRRVSRIRITSASVIGQHLSDHDAIHFEKNWTFIRLPYDTTSQGWSDRAALQQLIRSNFPKLYKENDVAIIPGCADGQIAIEVYANSLKNNVKLRGIVAADYNLPAMELGSATMSSFNLSPRKVRWVQANATHERFFQWIHRIYGGFNVRHQIATLLQPCLREEGMLNFLNHCSQLSYSNGISTTVIMPVLVHDPDSEWFQYCNRCVQDALANAKERGMPPRLIWNTVKYGLELLRLNVDKSSYVPDQYFISPAKLSEILNSIRYEDTSRTIFQEVENPLDYSQPQDPRRISQSPSSRHRATRIFCVWSTRSS
jgi:hypothetical protein